MLDLLTSDLGILLFSGVGLALTTLSIVRDARSQRERVSSDELYVEDVAA